MSSPKTIANTETWKAGTRTITPAIPLNNRSIRLSLNFSIPVKADVNNHIEKPNPIMIQQRSNQVTVVRSIIARLLGRSSPNKTNSV